MRIIELQNIKAYRIEDENLTESIIIIVEEGELSFYQNIELKYSEFEKAKEREMRVIE